MFVWEVILHSFLCFLKSWIIKHLCCPPLKTDSLASTLSKSEFGWFESAQDLWTLAVSSQMRKKSRNPSSWWRATKHEVLPRKESCHYSGGFAPGGLRFHYHSGAAETEVPHCTHTYGKLAPEMWYAVWGRAVIFFSLSHTPTLKHKYMSIKSKTFTHENTSKSHLPHQTIHVLLILLALG